MLARLMIASLFSLVLGNEAFAEGHYGVPTTATNNSGDLTASYARTAFAGDAVLAGMQDRSASQSALSGRSAMFGRDATSLFESHLYFTGQWSQWDTSWDARHGFKLVDPNDLRSPAGLAEVFIDDWQVGQYKSFSFHLKADDIVGLEIKSKFSF